MASGASADTPKKAKEFSNAYEMVMLVLTFLSLAIMVLLVLPLPAATKKLLTIYDNLICVVFLFDFVLRLRRAPTAGQYFFRERGWLDLLGSIPSLGIFRYSGLFRLARLSRVSRIFRMLRGQTRKEMVGDILTHRGQYAAFVTIMAAEIVLVVASVVVLSFEANAEGSNIKTGGDALWWGVVTLTTVGYGDRFPVTAGGRITGFFVMFMGVGIIGALASILASFLVSPTPAAEEVVSPEADAGQTEPALVDAPIAEGSFTDAAVAGATGSPAAALPPPAAPPNPASPASQEEYWPAILAELQALRARLDTLERA